MGCTCDTLINMMMDTLGSVAISNAIAKTEIEAQTYGRFIFAPLHPDMATVVGNMLRRSLLAHVSGAAITAVRIVGLWHEFCVIPNVREDVVQILQNLKRVRFRVSDENLSLFTINLSIHGDGVVTAGDFSTPPGVEIVNPDLHLFTIDRSTRVEIEARVERGVGFRTAPPRYNSLIGEIPLSANFSPVVRATYHISPASIQLSTGDETQSQAALTLEIWTDGTRTPSSALHEATTRLRELYIEIATALSDDRSLLRSESAEHPPSQPFLSPDIASMPLTQLNLSTRVYNVLRRSGMQTVGDVMAFARGDVKRLMALRNMGEVSLQELVERLQEVGVVFGGNESHGTRQ